MQYAPELCNHKCAWSPYNPYFFRDAVRYVLLIFTFIALLTLIVESSEQYIYIIIEQSIPFDLLCSMSQKEISFCINDQAHSTMNYLAK